MHIICNSHHPCRPKSVLRVVVPYRNEYYSYHSLTTISTLHDCNSAVEPPRSSNLGFSNFNLSARGEPTNCESILSGELIELS